MTLTLKVLIDQKQATINELENSAKYILQPVYQYNNSLGNNIHDTFESGLKEFGESNVQPTFRDLEAWHLPANIKAIAESRTSEKSELAHLQAACEQRKEVLENGSLTIQKMLLQPFALGTLSCFTPYPSEYNYIYNVNCASILI